ncbi:MAG: aldo/keto reductase [Halodesulfurarchaeum sp.]
MDQSDHADRTVTVSDIPPIGIGTWQNTDPDACKNAVQTALELGYRHVDTAQAYDNESAVGRGIEAASIDRSDVFLATKVYIDSLRPEDVKSTTEESMDRLGVDYLDLLYVHWPARSYDPDETLPAFQELYEEGIIENVGVSNFEREHLAEARSILDVPVFANQVEMHPLLPQEDLREYQSSVDVELVAYSPLARGAVFDVPEIQSIAEKHGVSEAQISLAWLLEKDVYPIPKATSHDHIADNFASLDVELEEGDIETIDGIERRERQVDPPFAPW